jgi:tetratricopeptide (TPR) repeat protein
LLIKEKYDLAEKDFQAAWNLDNRYLDAATGLARTAVAKKDMTAANKWVQTAIELPEGIRDKWVRTMAMQAKEAHKDTTLQDLMQSREKILSVDPADADNRLRLGDLYMRANEPGKAEAQFRYVYGQFKEEKIQAAIKLAELYQSTRRPEKAKGILNELQQQTTDRPGALLAYADYMLRTEGATPQCQQMIEEAIRLDDKDARGYLELGQFYRAAEQWEKAIAAMDKVLSLGAKGVSAAVESDVRASQIECAIRSHQFDRAQKDIDALFARNKNDPMAFSLQSALYQELGQAEKAKSVLDAALKIHTDSAGFYRSRGALHLRLGEMQEAQGDLAEARKLNPKDEAVGMTLGRVYERLRLYDKARAEYVGVMSQNPTNRDAYERLMQLYLRDRDWTKFSYMVEQARQAFPDEPKVLMQEGQMWLLRKEPEKGLAKMKQASDMPRGGEMDVLGTYLAALSSMGRYAEVLAGTEKRAAQADSPAWIQAARAAAVAKRNHHAETYTMFVQAFKVSTLAEASYIFQRARDAYGDAAVAEKAQAWGQAAPKNWAWQFELGQFYSQKINATPKGPARDELISRGVAQIVKARDLADNDKTKADINFFLGMLLQLVDKPQEAEQAYLLVLKTSPRHLQANNNLAVLCTEELNRPKQAIQYAETIMKYHEIDANSMDTYGWALARAGEYEKALDIMTRAKVQDPEMPDIRYHLGWTLEKLNKKPEAQAEFKRGAEIVGPDKGNRLYEPLQAGLQRTK